MGSTEDELREGLIHWLVSSDRVPTDLAAQLTLSAITPHRLAVWRFQGMWRRAYTGKLGRLRERHEVVFRETVNEAGEIDRVADGTRQKAADLTMVDIDGEESGPFDVVALEAAPPTPPGVGWFARAARGAAWEEVQSDPARWEALGKPLVDDVVDVAVRRALGSPDILNLDTDDALDPATTSRAAVTFWEVTGDVAGKPLRGMIGPDGTAWGDPPATDLPLSEQSEATARTLLIGAGYALAALVGLVAFVVPGVIIGAIGFFHVRHRLQARERMIGTRRTQQAPAIRALVAERLPPGG